MDGLMSPAPRLADPFFPLSFLVNSWLPGMLDDLFQSMFLCALLLFWLCVYHGIRVQVSRLPQHAPEPPNPRGVLEEGVTPESPGFPQDGCGDRDVTRVSAANAGLALR